MISSLTYFFFSGYGDHLDLHVLTHSFPTRRSSDLIQQETGGEDVFLHISAVERAGLSSLAEGQELQFNLVDRGGKVSAQDLQIVGEVVQVTDRKSTRLNSSH